MSLVPSVRERASTQEMAELKYALKNCGIDIRAFCEYLAEELAEEGHENESKAEKYRGWFKSGRLPEKQLFKQMWDLLREHQQFKNSQQIKPTYVSGIVDSDLERVLTKLSESITDQLN